jgi:HK97 family phage prohead protease
VESEFRSADLVDAEISGMNFRGYAAVFDSPWSDDLQQAMGYKETIARGAFRKALSAGNNVPLLWQHDKNQVLATTQSGNLRLKEDGKGLFVEANLPDTTLGRDVREMISRGDVRGMSYGIQTAREDSKVSRKDGVIHRSIANVRRLIDVTLTWEPAYPDTSVELRTLGFAALPVQAIVRGLEEQPDDAAGKKTSYRVSPYHGRMADLLISELEKGGIPL